MRLYLCYQGGKVHSFLYAVYQPTVNVHKSAKQKQKNILNSILRKSDSRNVADVRGLNFKGTGIFILQTQWIYCAKCSGIDL